MRIIRNIFDVMERVAKRVMGNTEKRNFMVHKKYVFPYVKIYIYISPDVALWSRHLYIFAFKKFTALEVDSDVLKCYFMDFLYTRDIKYTTREKAKFLILNHILRVVNKAI